MNSEQYRRWRLILGKDSEISQAGDEGREQTQESQIESNKKTHGSNQQSKQLNLSSGDNERDKLLDYLYQRESEGRGSRTGKESEKHNDSDLSMDDLYSLFPELTAGSGRSTIQPVEWLTRVRKAFPESTVDIMQKQAIERYQMHALLTDKNVMKDITPNLDMVQILLSFRHYLAADVMTEVRRIIRSVCQDLEKKLSQKIKSRFASQRIRQQHGGRKQLANIDWSASIRRNLKHYQTESEQLILEHLYFYNRKQQQIPWELIILVDQSGSMASSVIHASVTASIFCQLRSLKTRLILFDTEVVDMTRQIHDPVETLLAVQLGGGTDIGNALHYAQNCIGQNSRSLLILISDFEEGGDETFLYTQVAQLRESGVKMLGLAALDQDTIPWYDERIARQLVKLGMPVAAMTPDHLADWVAHAISG